MAPRRRAHIVQVTPLTEPQLTHILATEGLAVSPQNDDPAPVLAALHKAQATEGRLTRPAMERLASSFRLPVVDLYGAASFYHYFDVGDRPLGGARRCGGPACSVHPLPSGEGPSLSTIACPGLCDQPVAWHQNGRFSSASPGAAGPYALPREVDAEEALFRHIRQPGLAALATYRRTGGYQQLRRVAKGTTAPDQALDTLQASGLAGRGGAAFPLATKWRAVRETPPGPKYVVCNADEGEPGTFKDRPILHLNPHLLLEAMAIAGMTMGATTGIIYLRYEYPEAMTILERAIREAEAVGLLGKGIAGTDQEFYVHVRRGAGSYVCGEETALLNSLEGRRPWPRERPPFPTDSGLWGRPTAINNVETLCWVPLILERGAEWFRSLGRSGNAGTKIYSVSGSVQRPGNYELPLGVTAREVLYTYAGGPLEGRTLKAFTIGGISGGLLGPAQLDVMLDYTHPREHNTALGSGGMVVLDSAQCVVDFVRTCMLFYQSESCGRCSPCRVGTMRLRELLDGATGRVPVPGDALSQMQGIADVMATASACGLGQSAPLVVTGMLDWFRAELDQHVHQRHCPAGVCPLPRP